MALSRDARRRRLKKAEKAARRSGSAPATRYPDYVQTDRDRAEYRNFQAGLPLVNSLFFQDSLSQVQKWIRAGCPLYRWPEIKNSLSFVSSYWSDIGVKNDFVVRFQNESRSQTPDTQAIQTAWDEMIAFAAN